MTRIGDALYRLILLAFPAAFRRRHGEAMRAQFRAQRRALAGRPVALGGLWLRGMLDAAKHGLACRLEGRSARGTHHLSALPQDLWQAWRSIASRPAATLATVLVLAIGIGLTSSIFALADPFILRPLPYADPDRLAIISLEAENDRPGPFPTLEDFRARGDLFLDVAAYTPLDIERIRVRLTERDVMVSTATVSASFFDVLGLPVPLPADWGLGDERAETPILLLPGADASVGEQPAGAALRTQDGRVLRIAGALPHGFLFPRNRVSPTLSALAPLPDGPLMEVEISARGSTSSTSRTVVARLADGVTPELVQSVLSPPLSAERAYSLRAESLNAYMTRRLRPLALGAFAGALLIVLVCAANVANLLLVRSAFRTKELATRAALGASRGDLIRLLGIELGSLALLGVAGGLACAELALSTVAAVAPAEFVALGAPAVTGRIALFAIALGAIVMSCGVLPALAVWRLAPVSLLPHTAVTESRGIRLLRFTMAAGQSAVTMILIVGAALLGRSFLNLVVQDTGFAGEPIVVTVSYPAARTGEPLQRDIEATIDRLRRIPGVSVAAAATGTGMADGSTAGTLLRIDGRTKIAHIKSVTATYFDAVGSLIVAGRPLAVDDRQNGGVVVNARAAALWPGGSAVGRSIPRGGGTATIVGVVTDTFDRALDMPPEPMVFSVLNAPGSGSRVDFVIRATQPLETLRGPAERAISRVNREAIVTDVSAIDDRLAASIQDRSFATLVSALFAIAGLGVCVSGLVGLVSFVVARRTREIAIRTALGAQRHHVRTMVMRQALTAALTGAIAGLFTGWWLSRSLESLLYGIEPGDMMTLASAAMLMLIVVTIASWLPARRALRLSPTIALRTE
jgi:predicted permease